MNTNNQDLLLLIQIGAMIAISITIGILFLLSQHKLVNTVRKNGVPETFINLAWVWTQLIPIWGFIAIIVYHVKMINAIRILEIENKLSLNTLTYPVAVGWLYIFGFLYIWVPIIGSIVYFVIFVIFWIKIVSVRKQIKMLNLNIINDK